MHDRSPPPLPRIPESRIQGARGAIRDANKNFKWNPWAQLAGSRELDVETGTLYMYSISEKRALLYEKEDAPVDCMFS